MYSFTHSTEILLPLANLQSLTLNNAYCFSLPATSLPSLTTLKLHNIYLPLLHNAFLTSPITHFSLNNDILPFQPRSLEIILRGMESTLRELEISIPMRQTEVKKESLRVVVRGLMELEMIRCDVGFLVEGEKIGRRGKVEYL